MTSIDTGGPTSAQHREYAGPTLIEGLNDTDRSALADAKDLYVTRAVDLERQIEQTDDPQLEQKLTEELGRLQEAYDDFTDKLEELQSVGGVGSSAASTMISEFEQRVSESFQEFGTAGVSPDVEEQKPGWEAAGERLAAETPVDDVDDLPLTLDLEIDDVAETSETETGAETSSTDGSSESTGGVGDLDHSIEDLVNLMSNDPDAFYDEIGDLDPEQQNLVMTQVQQQLQEINQMFQMISQFQQVMHDTQSAVIQNMRV